MTVPLVSLRYCWMWLSYHLMSQPGSASNYILNISLFYLFYILLVKMPDIPLNLGHNMYKNRLLSVFPRAFSVHEILSSYQHVLIIRMLHFLIIKLIPWQFNTRVTPVFSYLISIPDNALSSIWSPVQHSCVLFHFVAHWV